MMELLVIGQYYYLVMDGVFGDNCDWIFIVLEGSIVVDLFMEVLLIEGLMIVCLEVNLFYSSLGLECVIEFSWMFNGVEISIVDSVEIDWLFMGVYEFCLMVFNVCDEVFVRC